MLIERTIQTLGNREKQILFGLFLSRYDQEALQYLGFDSFREAYNLMAFAVGARPASIKNYRDEFDPYFPNLRRGWHQRAIRPHCEQVMKFWEPSSLEEMGNTVRCLLEPSYLLDAMPEIKSVVEEGKPERFTAYARRAMTGRAAENFFRANFQSVSEFKGFSLTDTTQWGCGFDFKLTRDETKNYLAVEVKGIREKTGELTFTNLEYEVAACLKARYFLAAVCNFVEKPYMRVISNPANSELGFRRVQRNEVRVSWTAAIA